MPQFITVCEGDEIDLSFSSENLFSVRSSFSDEDGKRHSFAGQFLTLLNVQRSDVENAVSQVLNSAQDAEHYTDALKLTLSGKMSVIIQEMITADYSGVIFTANPHGILSETLIVTSQGCGSGVVDGTALTTTYHYSRPDEKYYYHTQDSAIKLPSKTVRALVLQGEKIQKLFGYYCDIEFCIKGDEIFILQCRPITALPKGGEIILNSSNIQESYPGVCLPATQSFARAVYKCVFESCVTILTNSEQTANDFKPTLSNMVDVFNARIYYRIDNWYCLLKILPFSSKIIPVWQEMLGVDDKNITSANINVSFGAKLKTACNFVKLMLIAPKKMKELDNYFKHVFENYKSEIEKESDALKLLDIYEAMLLDIGGKWGMTLINDMYAFIYTALAKRRNAKSLNNIMRLESLKPIYALDALAKTLKEHGMQSEQYKAEKEQYLELYGERCLEELKLETKTMSATPEVLDAYLQNYEEQSLPLAQCEKVSETYFVKRAKTGIYNRELSRMHRTRLYSSARKIFVKVGEQLTAANCIENTDDVFYLYIEELRDCIAQKTDMKSIIEKRKFEIEQFKKLPFYSQVVFKGKVFDQSPYNIKDGEQQFMQNELVGAPCAPGEITAEVLVVDKPSLGLDTSGKILVADTTDPGWVFLIRGAKGVIAQRGSLLSHTAIITRELKKPCVVGVKGAMRKLKSGDVVTLNGNTGVITIKDKMRQSEI